MNWYVAGPIRHRPNKNYNAFRLVKDDLESLGDHVITPFDLATQKEIDLNEENISPELCIRFALRDIDAIAKSDQVLFLDGWEHSVGARAEHAVALWMQKTIVYQSGLELPL